MRTSGISAALLPPFFQQQHCVFSLSLAAFITNDPCHATGNKPTREQTSASLCHEMKFSTKFSLTLFGLAASCLLFVVQSNIPAADDQSILIVNNAPKQDSRKLSETPVRPQKRKTKLGVADGVDNATTFFRKRDNPTSKFPFTNKKKTISSKSCNISPSRREHFQSRITVGRRQRKTDRYNTCAC